jgi:DNA-binding NarL/FixJ family response regulator
MKGRDMTVRTQTIGQLVKLSTRVAEAWLNKPSSAGNVITSQAILTVCKHLSREASYRSDIAELIRLCEYATTSSNDNKGQGTHNPPASSKSIEKILTTRQIEILQLFSRGLSYEEVGAQLHVTPQTVKNHASAIYGRLGVKNKTEAIFEARAIGLEF